MQSHNKKVLLIGAGQMSKDYLRVMNSLDISIDIVCRRKESAESFEEETDHKVFSGGLKKYFQKNKEIPDYAIVAVNISNLMSISEILIRGGVKKILIEKPGAQTLKEINLLDRLATKNNVNAYVAYNRRFYSSVTKAKDIIVQDGGVSSFTFEFTEWSHVIKNLDKEKSEMQKWFINNSSHVVDLAFYLGGSPNFINTVSNGEGELSWHPAASSFSGSGKTINNAIFSYHADWSAPGRWGVEILTKNHRLILRPMEKLYVQEKGSVEIELAEIDDELDIEFKPGLYRQVEAFLKNEIESFCTVNEQKRMMDIYYKISNYKSEI
ncbi:MAG: Gfo/Idh/MocA family oxidoreductase [Gammaproteobacteria bacterium]|nr:Gfo/Idh/MocA family oxidoreductase [Gammaproteobacteria bacterium]